jgi:hypothetical protein
MVTAQNYQQDMTVNFPGPASVLKQRCNILCDYYVLLSENA